MSFLRRILGGGDKSSDERPAEEPESTASVADVADAEAARDRELLLEDARRLDDDLIQRQMRYADRAWTPPAQGGERRADDTDEADKG